MQTATFNRAANRSNTALSDEFLQREYPTLFAERPHLSRSDRYEYIPTSNIIGALRKEGFSPVKVQVSRVRDPKPDSPNFLPEMESRKGFEKHLIRFRQDQYINRSDTATRAIGDVFPEVILTNSHDGSSAYTFSAGLFRLVCLNGMVVADASFGSIRIPHKGSIVDNAMEATYKVLRTSNLAIERAQQWQQLMLTEQQTLALATGAHFLRFADSEGNVNTPIRPEQLLTAKRPQDNGSDLWRTFNRIQENIIRGGLTAQQTAPSAAGRRPRWITTREVNGIDGQLNFNRGLWELADEMATLVAQSN